MRKIPILSLTLSLLMGICVFLFFSIRDRESVKLDYEPGLSGTRHRFSTNGKYFVSLTQPLNERFDSKHQRLQLYDLASGKRLKTVSFISLWETDWCADDEGALLFVRKTPFWTSKEESDRFFSQSMKGRPVEQITFTYALIRISPGTNFEQELSRWQYQSNVMSSVGVRFLFNSTGTHLLSSRHSTRNTILESVDTRTGSKTEMELPRFTRMDNPVRLPRSKGFLVLASTMEAATKEYTVHFDKNVALVINEAGDRILHRWDFPRPFRYSVVTGDGEHLLCMDNERTPFAMIHLTTGKQEDLPPAIQTLFNKLNRDENQTYQTQHRFDWATPFGQCYVHTQRFINTSKQPAFVDETCHVIDWTRGTHQRVDKSRYIPLQWIPHSKTVLVSRQSYESNQPIKDWYYQFLRWMKWGNPPGQNRQFAILDTETNKITSWVIRDSDASIGYMSHISPDGSKMVAIKFLDESGMQSEVWGNPLVASVPMLGVIAGLISILICFFSCRWIAQGYRHRFSRQPDISAVRIDTETTPSA